MSEQKIILIGGPTASGKSALALRIAARTSGSIINADAMQVYAGLPILTAQPDAQSRAEIPHLLYETCDAADASSAGKWLALAQDAIRQVFKDGRTPIVVGGTGLYFRALLGGLAAIPDIPAAVRAEASALYDRWGEEKFRAELARRDPAAAARLARNDRQRLIRAYEVARHTGKTLDEWHRQGAEKRNSALFKDTETHLLLPPRDALYAACDSRFEAMIQRGAVEEVRALLQRGLSPSLPAMKVLGVRQIAAYLRHESSLDDAINLARQATRNYAKRQMTWFRNQWAVSGQAVHSAVPSPPRIGL